MTPLSQRLAILRVLSLAQPYTLPQDTLLTEVNHAVRPALTLGDLVKHLTWLKAHDMAAYQPDPLDPENADARKWFIREAGLTALNS